MTLSIPTSLILIFLLSVLSIAVIVLFYMLTSQKREIMQIKEFNNKLFSRLTNLMQDMQTMSSAAVGISQRVNKITNHVQSLDIRQDEIDLRDQTEKPIQQAIALIGKGAGLDEIMQNCQLTRAEAELLMHIHRE